MKTIKSPTRIAAEETLKKERGNLDRIGRSLLRGDGAALMEVLTEEYYDSNPTSSDTAELNRWLGRRDVVVFLRSILPKEK
jgi:hypothetical protein